MIAIAESRELGKAKWNFSLRPGKIHRKVSLEKIECLVSYRANGKTASRCLQLPSVPPMRKMGQKGEQLNSEAKLVVGGFLQRGLGRRGRKPTRRALSRVCSQWMLERMNKCLQTERLVILKLVIFSILVILKTIEIKPYPSSILGQAQKLRGAAEWACATRGQQSSTWEPTRDGREAAASWESANSNC